MEIRFPPKVLFPKKCDMNATPSPEKTARTPSELKKTRLKMVNYADIPRPDKADDQNPEKREAARGAGASIFKWRTIPFWKERRDYR